MPLHSWQARTYAEAPAGAAVLLAGAMAKIGVYGFLRFVLPLFPALSAEYSSVFVVLGLIGVVGGALWGAWIWRSDHDGTRIYYGTDTRAPAIALGAALAGILQWRGPVRSARGRQLLEAAGIAGMAVLAVAWYQLDGDRLYRGGLLVCSVAALAIIASVTHPRPGIVARVLGVGPLVTLGIISYGLYLWHWPIYVVLDRDRTGLDGWPLFGVRLAVTLAVATASYLVVERPIRQGTVRLPRPRVALPALVGALVLGVFVATTGAVASGPLRPTVPDPVHAAAAARRSQATRVLVGGNSVASSVAVGLAHVRGATPIAVLNDGMYSCDFPPSKQVRDESTPKGSTDSNPLRLPTTPFNCADPWPRAVATFNPAVAILVVGDVHLQGYRFRDGWVSECDRKFAPHYRRALDDAVRVLGARQDELPVARQGQRQLGPRL